MLKRNDIVKNDDKYYRILDVIDGKNLVIDCINSGAGFPMMVSRKSRSLWLKSPMTRC